MLEKVVIVASIGESIVKFLIVEDDFTSRIFLQGILEEFGPVHIAVNGLEAIEVFSPGSYDLVLLDIYMPGLSGHEVLKVIREKEKVQGVRGSDRVKVFITSSSKTSEDVLGAFRGQCDEYLSKPYEQKEVLRLLVRHGLLTEEELAKE